MSEDDFDAFVQVLDDFASLRQLPPLDARAKALFFRAVAEFPLPLVLRAIEAHLRDPEEGKFKAMVQPAHIIGQIQRAAGQDGRPTGDEAWAIALASQDEADTVIWTAETAQAFAAARPVLARGDEVGARMAFKAAYERLVGAARREGRAPVWQASLGWDPALREQAIVQAVDQGRLPAPVATVLLPPPAGDTPGDEAVAEANIKRLRQMLANVLAPSQRREQAAAAERERLEHLKAESAAKVFQHAGDVA